MSRSKKKRDKVGRENASLLQGYMINWSHRFSLFVVTFSHTSVLYDFLSFLHFTLRFIILESLKFLHISSQMSFKLVKIVRILRFFRRGKNIMRVHVRVVSKKLLKKVFQSVLPEGTYIWRPKFTTLRTILSKKKPYGGALQTEFPYLCLFVTQIVTFELRTTRHSTQMRISIETDTVKFKADIYIILHFQLFLQKMILYRIIISRDYFFLKLKKMKNVYFTDIDHDEYVGNIFYTTYRIS